MIPPIPTIDALIPMTFPTCDPAFCPRSETSDGLNDPIPTGKKRTIAKRRIGSRLIPKR